MKYRLLFELLVQIVQWLLYSAAYREQLKAARQAPKEEANP